MACKSARMPSLETAACIQYQKTQGRATAGGCRNVCGSNPDCAGTTWAATASGKNNSMLIHSRIVDRIVMIFLKRDLIIAGGKIANGGSFTGWLAFTSKTQGPLTGNGMYPHLVAAAIYLDISMRRRHRSFHPLEAAKCRFHRISCITGRAGFDAEIIFPQQIKRAGPPGMAKTSAKRPAIH